VGGDTGPSDDGQVKTLHTVFKAARPLWGLMSAASAASWLATRPAAASHDGGPGSLPQ
jgi:hypothetical protein